MNGNVFLDTNIIIYAYSLSDSKKQTTASGVLLNYDCVISTQVINEYCNVCFKKNLMRIPEILLDVDNILDICELVKIDEATIKQALSIKNSYGYSYYDSLILSSALESNCSILYSEDLQHGQVIENSLKIVNPFV
jgi:predicted nucleic acid-binding protein